MEKLDVIIIIAALLLVFVLILGTFLPEVVETGSWGLSFSGEHLPPAGPASGEALARFDAAYLGDTEDKVIYLTFDAGYENGCTEKILDTLKAHDAPAVFFLTGHYIDKNPDLVRRMASEGHTVGNHTMHHPDMSKLATLEEFSTELHSLEKIYQQTVGSEMEKFYRPPQGVYSQSNLEHAQALGYRTVFWSLAYADWDNANQPTREAALEKLLGRIHNGAVVLLHSTSRTNAEILDEVLTAWEDMGYRFAPIGELFS